MSSLIINQPPKHIDYLFYLGKESIKTPDPRRIAYVQETLGGKINDAYADGSKLTPIQKAKIATITACACAALVSVALLAAGVILHLTPLYFVAVPLLVAGGALAYYVFTRIDLDHPRTREKIMQEIAQASFDMAMQAHPSINIIGYALLDKLTPSNCTDPEKRTLFYTRFEQLKHAWQRLNAWNNATNARIDSQWTIETQPLRNWYQEQQARIEHQRALTKQNEVLEREHKRKQDEAQLRPVNGIKQTQSASISTPSSDYKLLAELAEIKQKFVQTIPPWNAWRTGERANLHTTTTKTLTEIEDLFKAMKEDVAGTTTY